MASENEKLIETRVSEVASAHSKSVLDLGATVASIGDQVNDIVENDKKEDFDGLTDRIDERIKESERRSADAITQIGEQVARVAERLQTQHAESLKSLENRLASSERSHKSKLNDALNGMSQRLQELGEETTGALQSVHKNISSLAQRIADLEDGSDEPPKRETQRTAPVLMDLDDDAENEPDLLGAGPMVVDDDDDEVITSDVVGSDPPPYDESTDAQLFDKEAAPTKAADRHRSQTDREDLSPASRSTEHATSLKDLDKAARKTTRHLPNRSMTCLRSTTSCSRRRSRQNPQSSARNSRRTCPSRPNPQRMKPIFSLVPARPPAPATGPRRARRSPNAKGPAVGRSWPRPRLRSP